MGDNLIPKTFAYVLTINNWTDDDKGACRALRTPLTYCCFAEEFAPTTGTPHLQGLIITTKQDKARCNKALNNRASLTLMTFGDTTECQQYCKGPWKEPGHQDYKPLNETFEEYGKFEILYAKKKGERTDIQRVLDSVKGGKSFDEICELHTDTACRYAPFIKERISATKVAIATTAAVARCIDPYGWQLEAWELLRNQDARKILWIWSTHGGRGKSQFIDWVELKQGGIIFEGGKKNDIAHLYSQNMEKYVCFDFTRSKQEEDLKYMYDIVESFKNGRMNSMKYECKRLRFQCNIVIAANIEPDYTKWSSDRYEVLRVD